MLYICIVSNKLDLKQAIRDSHNWTKVKVAIICKQLGRINVKSLPYK